INALRRTALNTVAMLRGLPPKRTWKPFQTSHNRHKNAAFEGYTLEIRKLSQLTPAMQAHKPQTVYVPLAELAGEPDTVRSLLSEGMPLAVHMPRIYTDAEQPEIERMLDV